MNNELKRYWLLLFIITFIGAILRLYGITEQPALSDEIGVAISSVNYMENGLFGPTMWYHPNLRNIVIYWIGEMFGYGSYALRGMSLMTGILTVPIIGMLLYSLTGDRRASLIVSFLISVDQVHITFSRQAIQETWTTFFFLLGVYLAVRFYQKERMWLLILSGIVFGLGISSKFHAFFPMGVCIIWGLWYAIKDRSFSKALFVSSCLLVIPFIVYLLTYIPWFGRGYGIMDWFEMQRVLFIKMATHQGNPMDQLIDIKAWQWFLRPMGYANFVYTDGNPYVTVAYSNPVVWLLIVPSLIFLLWRKRRNLAEDQGLLQVMSLFIVSYLPLALSTRPIWLLSSLAVLPFAFMIISLFLSRLVEVLSWGKNLLIVYTIIVLFSSLALYPMATGRAKQYDYLKPIVERFRPPFERINIP